MALQVCEYPACKKLTLTKRCNEHPLDEDETDDELDKRLTEILTTKETTIMPDTLCTKKGCAELKANDSVKCPHHRDMKARANARFQGRSVKTAPIYTKRKYTKRTPLVPQLPVARKPYGPSAIRLAEPTIVNGTPTRSVDLNGALTELDSFINKLSDDLATLQGAKEIMETYYR